MQYCIAFHWARDIVITSYPLHDEWNFQLDTIHN